MPKAYVVTNGEGAAQTWAWIEAESIAEIEAAFRDLTIYEPAPAWASPKLMKDFGAYRIDGPLDPWPERLRRSRR
jgi:hypothetical protein